MNVEKYIHASIRAGRKMIAVLLDPENLTTDSAIARIGHEIASAEPDFVLSVGVLLSEVRQI